MSATSRLLLRLWREEQGTEVMEWVLVAGLVVIGTFLAIKSVGLTLSGKWKGINDQTP